MSNEIGQADASNLLEIARAAGRRAFKNPNNQAYMTAVHVLAALREAGATQEEQVGLLTALRQSLEGEFSQRMVEIITGPKP